MSWVKWWRGLSSAPCSSCDQCPPFPVVSAESHQKELLSWQAGHPRHLANCPGAGWGSSPLLPPSPWVGSPTWEISARMMLRYCLPCPRASMAAKNSFLSWISFTSSSNRSSSGAGSSCRTWGTFFRSSLSFPVAKIFWSLRFSFSRSPVGPRNDFANV